MDTFFNVLLVVLVILIAVVVASPWLAKKLGPKLQKKAIETYQARLFKRVKKQYPLLAERIDGYEMTAETQEHFQSAMKKLPPQEAMKLQAEFLRLRDKFMERHPEVTPLVQDAQDGKAQSKALDALLKLPEDKRQALEKDLLWAWDQLRGRFPKLMGQVEAAFKKKTPTP